MPYVAEFIVTGEGSQTISFFPTGSDAGNQIDVITTCVNVVQDDCTTFVSDANGNATWFGYFSATLMYGTKPNVGDTYYVRVAARDAIFPSSVVASNISIYTTMHALGNFTEGTQVWEYSDGNGGSQAPPPIQDGGYGGYLYFVSGSDPAAATTPGYGTWPRNRQVLGTQEERAVIRPGNQTQVVIQRLTHTTQDAVQVSSDKSLTQDQLSGVIRFRRPISTYRVPSRVRG